MWSLADWTVACADNTQTSHKQDITRNIAAQLYLQREAWRTGCCYASQHSRDGSSMVKGSDMNQRITNKISSQSFRRWLLFTAMAIMAGRATQSVAHGYVDYPKARQQVCKDDGGYWWPADGSGIANAACRAAFRQSGGYLFSQHHEYSANVPQFSDLGAVQAVVKDGSLCAAGDSRKAGMDLASSEWQKTVIDVDATPVLRLRFRATTPHNPSFWQIYLSKPGVDVGQAPLQWQQLRLIHQQADVAVNQGYYELDVPLPTHQRGAAVLYTRWQRQDVVGEGFYNCSDIWLQGSGGSEPVWHDQGQFVAPELQARVGETVLFRLFDGVGQELLQHRLAITAQNVTAQRWAEQLAADINRRDADKVQLGVRSESSQAVVWQPQVALNRVWTLDRRYSISLRLVPAAVTYCGIDPARVTLYPAWPRRQHSTSPGYAQQGDYMAYGGRLYQAKWWTQTTPGSDQSWQFVCQYE
jgi:chitin-binding protein